MTLSPVIELLNRERGLRLDASYYANIGAWEDWWRGYHRPFHRFRERGAGGEARERDLYSLRMAKKICEDWASLLLNEKTSVVLADNRSNVFLQGENGTGGVFGEAQFWFHANQLVERAFATGTGAMVLHVDGMRADPAGPVRESPDAVFHIDYLSARSVVPLTVRQDRITEAAFCSEVLDKGERRLYLEIHTLEPEGYVVENRYFKCGDGALIETALPEGVVPRILTRSPLPLFAILRPNIVNSIDDSCGLGMSIFAGAIDNLKGVDLAFNNFCRDFQLGGKKVFYNESLVAQDGNGLRFTPDDICQQLFLSVGDKMPDDKQLIQEHNPELRVAENAAGVQAQLDYLSFKCGLGAKRYRFDNRAAQVTATQYLGENQELAQNVSKQYIAVEQMLGGMIRAILWAGRDILGQPVDPDTAIDVQFDDSVIVDKATERMQDKEDVRDGIMHKWEFRVKWYGEDEATAKRMAPDDDESDDEVMGFADAPVS